MARRPLNAALSLLEGRTQALLQLGHMGCRALASQQEGRQGSVQVLQAVSFSMQQ
jgi:hypothetical protein